MTVKRKINKSVKYNNIESGKKSKEEKNRKKKKRKCKKKERQREKKCECVCVCRISNQSNYNQSYHHFSK